MVDAPTPFEDRLRSALAAGIARAEADAGAPVADPADLARRRVEHHHRQRAGRVAAAAVLVVVGVLGGWALTRGDGGGDVEEVAGVPSTVEKPVYEGEGSTTVAAADIAPDPSRVLEQPGALPIVVPQPPDPGTDSGAAARAAAGAGVGVSYSPEGRWYDGTDLPAGDLTTRTFDDGATVRVGANRYDPAIYELPPFWAPPAWCFPIGDVNVRVDGVDGLIRTVRYAASEDGTVDVRTTTVEDDAGRDRWLTLVHAPAGTDVVRLTYPGGQEVEGAPFEGLAVLTAAVGEGVDLDDDPVITAVAVALDGTELARHEGPWSDDALGEPVADPPYLRPACAVPTELPAPGAEQPTDPGAAEAALRQSWDQAFGDLGAVTTAEQLQAVADTRGVADALDRVRELVSPEVMAQTTIEIDGVVFASPERAFVHYTVGIAAGTYADLFGELVLVHGRWKVTRKTACDLAETGGGICQPIPAG